MTGTHHHWITGHRRALALTVVPMLAAGLLATAHVANAADGCTLPAGKLTKKDLPPGKSVHECRAVGRAVTDGGVGVSVPEPGHRTSVSMDGDNGSVFFAIDVALDGTITYPQPTVHNDLLAGEVEPLGTAIPACNDSNFAIMGAPIQGAYKWYLGDGPTKGVSRSDLKNLIVDAITNITMGYNDCNFSDTINAYSAYQHYTDRDTNMGLKDGVFMCTAGDGVSVWDVDWLPESWNAYTCREEDKSGNVVGADVRLSSRRTWTANVPSDCNGKFDVRHIATHEAGHVYGLADLYGDEDRFLTMYGFGKPCKFHRRTLGMGDMIGLTYLYP